MRTSALNSASQTAATSPSRIGVCSWSMRPGSARELADRVSALGLSCVQLALDPVRERRQGWSEIETMQALRSAGIVAISGMMAMRGEDYSTLETIRLTGGVRMESTWEENVAAARANARLARRMGIPLVTFHAGFIPHEDGDDRWTMLERLRVLADVFDDCGVRLAFETGQERAETLLDALGELDRMGGAQVGVNFDPANMILYGMGDPVDAVKKLAARIVQVHIKDSVPTKKAGTWGSEVCAGTGAVKWGAFFDVLRKEGVACDFVIEREAGVKRDGDIAEAKRLVESHVPAGSAEPDTTARAGANSRGSTRPARAAKLRRRGERKQ